MEQQKEYTNEISINNDTNTITKKENTNDERNCYSEIIKNRYAKKWLANTADPQDLSNLSKLIEKENGIKCNFPRPQSPRPEPEWFKRRQQELKIESEEIERLKGREKGRKSWTGGRGG